MSKIDTAELIRILTTTPRPPHDVSVVPALGVVRQQSGELRALRVQLQSILAKAGFDFEEMNKLAEQNRIAVRRHFKKQQSEVAKELPQKKAALLKALADRRSAVNSLPFGPTLPQYYLLEEPLLIWQTPNIPKGIVESNVEPNNSWMKVLIDTNGSIESRHQGESQPPQPEGIAFTFYFLWQNPNDFAVVTNISTFLILTGAFELDSEAGWLSGDKVTLSLEASLTPLEWWIQPPSVPVAEQSQTQSVLNLSAQGGGFWSAFLTLSSLSVDTETGSVTLKPFELNYSLFSVPPNGPAIFEVTLKVAYDYPSSSNAGDRVLVDFYTGENSIICPYFLIEVLPTNRPIVSEP
jgi:hypothetical protein